MAVKVFTVDLSRERARELADLLERLVERGLAHAHIAAPIAAGTEDGVAYLASEYVAAEGTDTALRQYGPAPVPEALRLVRRLAGAIDFAATVGVHHGCLHPRDILVAPEEARITGFGVAEALESVGLRAPIRRPYSSPERIDGGAVDRSSDIYALASLSFELLLGRRLTGAGEDGLAGLEDLRHADVAGLRETFACALDPNPDLRFRTAQNFADTLQSHFGRTDTARVVDFARPAEIDVSIPDLRSPIPDSPSPTPDPGSPIPDPRSPVEEVSPTSAFDAPPLNLLPARTQSGLEEDRSDQDDHHRWDDEAPSLTPGPGEITTRAHDSGFGMRDWDSARPAKAEPLTPSFTPGLSEWAASRAERAPKPELKSSDELGSDADFNQRLTPISPSGLTEWAENRAERAPKPEFESFEELGSDADLNQRLTPISAEWDADLRAEPRTPKPWDAPFAPGHTTEDRFAALAQDRPGDSPADVELDVSIPDPDSPIPDPRSPILDPRSPIPDSLAPIPDPWSSSVPDPRSPTPDPRSPTPDPRSPTTDSANLVDDLRPSGYLSTDAPVPRAFTERRETSAGSGEDHAFVSTARPRSRGLWKIVAALVAGGVVGVLVGLQVERRVFSGPVTKAVPASATARPSPPTPKVEVSSPPAPTVAAPAPKAAAAPSAGTTPPPSAASASTAAADQPARIEVRSTPPGADVMINGRGRGVTPQTVQALAYGSYTVQVSRSGYTSEQRQVSLSRGQPSASLTFTLRPSTPAARSGRPEPAAPRPSPAPSASRGEARPPAPAAAAKTDRGSVSVDSRPRGARVLVDGQPVGTTPLSIAQVPAGAHSVRLELPGYRPWIASVGVVEGQQTRVAASLEPETEK